MKRVLVTGLNGYIGRHCLPFLFEKGYEVHGIVPTGEMKLDYPGVQWEVANLLDSTCIPSIVEKVKPSHLLHFAWITTPGVYWTSSDNLRWLVASLELLHSFKFHGGQRVLMAGSCAEYDWRFGYCTENITPLKPATLYGICKRSLYEILMSFADQEGISAAWGRIFYLYGPHEHPSRLVPSVINSLLDGQPAPCTHGKQIRDYMHVEDVASAFTSLLDSEVKGAINVASGKPITLEEIIFQIAEKIGRPDLIQLGAIPAPASEPPLLVADVNRLTQDLGWYPSLTLDAGMSTVIDWWKGRR